MSKRFTLIDLVQLPKLDAVSAVTLVHRLLAIAATKKRLPSGIVAAKKKLATGHHGLELALVERLPASGVDTQRSKLADIVIDRAAKAFHDFLFAYSQLPDSEPLS